MRFSYDPIHLAIEGAVIGFLIALPVGPAAILCIRRTITGGLLAGYATGFGAGLGDAVFGAVAAFGLSIISDFMQQHDVWLRGFGGALLIVMGVATMRHRARAIGDPVAADRAHPLATLLRYVSSSFLITVFNPITVMAFGVVFASRGLTDVATYPLDAWFLVCAVFFGALGWWALLCGLAALFRTAFSGSALQWLNRGSGAALALFGLAALASLLPLGWDGLIPVRIIP